MSGAAIGALAVATTGQVSGQTSSADTDTSTLTLENDGAADSVRYQLAWGSRDDVSIDRGEFSSETSIEISGELLRFAAVGVDEQSSLTITLDGEEIDPKNRVDIHTLTIDAADDSYREYELVVESDLAKSAAFASVNSKDTVDGTEATGSIAGGRDSYTYTGSLARFQGEDVTVYIDGKVRDPMELVSTHTLTIERDSTEYDIPEPTPEEDISPDEEISPEVEEEIELGTPLLKRPPLPFPEDEPRSYELVVESDLEKSDGLGSIQENDTVDGTTASGTVAGGRDSYTYTGSLARFQGEGVNVLIDGQSRDPFDLVETHTLTVDLGTLDSAESEPESRQYTLSVEDDLEKSDGLGSIQDNDSIDGTTATGVVSTGQDSYTYTGSLERFTADDFGSFSEGQSIRLLVDGRARDPTELVDTHTLTISGDRLEDTESDDDTRIDYTLSVPSDLQKSDALDASINESDDVDGTTATGTVTTGRDSYTYTGEPIDLSDEEGRTIPVVLDGRAAITGLPVAR